jgi:hypothetical protein
MGNEHGSQTISAAHWAAGETVLPRLEQLLDRRAGAEGALQKNACFPR